MAGDTATIGAAPAPLLVDAAQAAALCGVSRATWFSWQAAGRVPAPALRAGRVVRWSVDEVRRWIEAGCPSVERFAVLTAGGRRP